MECGALEYWFKEIYDCIGVPAGKLEHHPEGDTFNHLMEVLQKTCKKTGNIYARWAAVCHDLGKGKTDKDLLPAHHGHELRNMDCISSLCNRLNTPTSYTYTAGVFAREHMRIHRLPEMKAGKAVRTILNLSSMSGGIESAIAVASADGNENKILSLMRIAPQEFLEVSLPEKHRGKGIVCAEILLNLRALKWKDLKKENNPK